MMKVGPHVITHSHCSIMHNHDNREMVPRVGTPQSGGNLKLIQCQLMLLLHARRCQQRKELMISTNRQATVTNNVARAILLNCPIRHCRAMKDVLDHMKRCQLGSGCTFQHCTTSLRILSHWTNCTVVDCPLCQCVRQRMRRAKEWEATLPRSSRYTLLAAALRSSQTPRPVPPNCHVAEQAEEGQSGVPCQGQDELRPIDGNGDNHDAQQKEQSNDCDKPMNEMEKTAATNNATPTDAPVPSLDQVRSAYEQLGIPCPESALKRLMATLPSSSRHRAKRHHHEISKSSRPSQGSAANMMDTNENNDEGNPDHGVFDCSTHSPASSSSSNSDSDPEPPSPSSSSHHMFLRRSFQQHLISSTTTATTRNNPTISSRNQNPFKSSSCSRSRPS